MLIVLDQTSGKPLYTLVSTNTFKEPSKPWIVTLLERRIILEASPTLTAMSGF